MTPRDDTSRRSPYLVRIGSTGKDPAELVETVAITKKPGDGRVVAMSLGPNAEPDLGLADLRPGDRLEICAELEVTVDLTPKQARDNYPEVVPTGTPYDYAPAVVAQLVLAGSPELTVPKKGRCVAMGPPKRIKLGHDLHHAVFVFDGAGDAATFDVPASGLGWNGKSYVNLVLSANHASAGPGHLLLVGQNEPDGSVEGDMGAISAIRVRPATGALPQPISDSDLRVPSLPIQGDAKRVVYSTALKRLRANEQLRIRADVVASTRSMGYKARLKTRVFLADSPDQLEPSGRSYAAGVASFKAQVAKGNGFNCLPSAASVTFSKVGVLRMLASADRELHLNVVAVAGDPEKRGEQDSVKLLRSGGVSVQRLPAGAHG